MDNVVETIVDTAIDYGDSAINTLSNNALLQEIPILKLFIAGTKDAKCAYTNHEKKKLVEFLTICNDLSDQEVHQFLGRHAKNPDKTGERVMEQLSALDQSEKIPLVGKIYNEMILAKRDFDDCERIILIIQKANYKDLLLLKHFNDDVEIINNGKNGYSTLGIDCLYHAGLLNKAPWGDGGEPDTPEEDYDIPGYFINEYGKLIRNCL